MPLPQPLQRRRRRPGSDRPDRPGRSDRFGRPRLAGRLLAVGVVLVWSLVGGPGSPAASPGGSPIGSPGRAPAAPASPPPAPVNDPLPAGSSVFPADYGPDANRLFSPLQVPPDARRNPAAYLVLNVAARRLYLYAGGTLAAVYPVAVGLPDHHTPIGRYRIFSKAISPTWYPPDGRPPVPPGPDNPLGTRWMGWLETGYGLHGTNADWSVGRAVSHGCVRLHNADAEAVFERVLIGTPLEIVYEPVELSRTPSGFVLSLYEDVYGRVPDYAAFLGERLTQAGVGLDPDMVAWLLAAATRYGGVTLDTASPVLVGSRQVDTAVLFLGPDPGASPLVSVRAVGEALGLSVGWDACSGRPTLDGSPVTAVLAGGRAYASPVELTKVSPVALDWLQLTDPPTSDGLVPHRLLLRPGLVFAQGHLVSRQAFRRADGTYLPLRAVAEAFGLEPVWDGRGPTATLGGVVVSVVTMGGRGYVRSDVLAAALAAALAEAGVPVPVTVSETADGIFVTRGDS